MTDPAETPTSTVVPFPQKATRAPASHERIWGKPVLAHGYTALPSILVKAQRRLGLTPMQFNILVSLLDYWHEPSKAPFPSKQTLAERLNVTKKTIQTNIRSLEKVGYVTREIRRTAAGVCKTNVYHLDGLVNRIRQLEPEFAEAKTQKALARAAQDRVEKPAYRRAGRRSIASPGDAQADSMAVVAGTGMR